MSHKPFLSVNHLQGPYSSAENETKNEIYPFLCLLVSGGLLSDFALSQIIMKVKEILGETIDDASRRSF